MAKKKPQTKDLLGKALAGPGAKDDRKTVERSTQKKPMGRPPAFPKEESTRVTYRIHQDTDKALRRALIDSEHETLSELADALLRDGLGLPKHQ